MNQYVKKTIVPACLLSLAGLAGCHGYEQYETGLPWIDRMIAPRSVESWPPEEQIVPHEGPALPAAPPAPVVPPPSELIQPKLPALPNDAAQPGDPALPGDKPLEVNKPLEINREPYFGEGIGLTPLPRR